MKRFRNFVYIFIGVISVVIVYKLSQLNFSKEANSQPSEQIVVFKKEDVENLLKEHLNNKNAEKKKKISKVTTQTNKKEIKYSFLTKYPSMLECNTHENVLKKWSPTSESSPSDDYKSPAPETTFGKRFLRGILVYFPLEKSNEFMHEFKWLYRSWIEMIRNEPSKWRTDLVVFTARQDDVFAKKEFFLNELNCSFSNRRTSELDKPMCTLVDYKPIATREFKPLTLSIFHDESESEKKKKFDYLLANVDVFSSNEDNLLPFYTIMKENLKQYGYTDSILMAFDGYDYFKSAKFDFLIRSDMDVFLTPLFSKWLPKNCNDFIVGGGAYSENFNRKRLKRIALELDLEHAGADNLGSTWYSTPDQFRIVSYLTLFGMIYISKEEFAQPEKQGKVSLWPYWHYGVLLLYGQNLGMNHLIASKHINIVKLNNMIDYPSGNTEDVITKLHIHVYHGGEMFSKFSFKEGKYDNMTVPTENLNQVKNYCLKLALESKRTQPIELNKLLLSEANKKD